MSVVGFSHGGRFEIVGESFAGRIVLDNSSRIILRNVTFEDRGYYKCRNDYSNGVEETKVRLKIGGLFPFYSSARSSNGRQLVECLCLQLDLIMMTDAGSLCNDTSL